MLFFCEQNMHFYTQNAHLYAKDASLFEQNVNLCEQNTFFSKHLGINMNANFCAHNTYFCALNAKLYPICLHKLLFISFHFFFTTNFNLC